MIGDVIDTFRKNKPALNKKFVRKVNLIQVPATRSHTPEFDITIMSLQERPICCSMLKNEHQKNPKIVEKPVTPCHLKNRQNMSSQFTPFCFRIYKFEH